MKKTNKLYLALGLAGVIALAGFAVFTPEPLSFASAPVDQCMPTGVGVLQTAQVAVNELVSPECK